MNPRAQAKHRGEEMKRSHDTDSLSFDEIKYSSVMSRGVLPVHASVPTTSRTLCLKVDILQIRGSGFNATSLFVDYAIVRNTWGKEKYDGDSAEDKDPSLACHDFP